MIGKTLTKKLLKEKNLKENSQEPNSEWQGKETKKDLRGEEIGMRNKAIPTKRGIQIQVTVQMFVMNRNPCEYNHNSFRFTFFPSPVNTTTTKHYYR
jgi:hypothetical protein